MKYRAITLCLAMQAAECSKLAATIEVGFKVVQLECVFSNRHESLGRQPLFLATSFQPISLSPDEVGIQMLACSRRSTFGLSFSSRSGVTVTLKRIIIDMQSAFTGASAKL